MQIALTKKLTDALNIKPTPADEEIDPIFTWTANWITTWMNRKAEDMLVLVNQANRFTVAIYQVKRNELKDIENIIQTAIKNTLLALNINADMVDAYIDMAGEFTFVKNTNRKATSWVNKAGQESADFVEETFNGIDRMYDDSTIGVYVSEIRMGTAESPKKYAVPAETMVKDLAELTGVAPYNYRALEFLVTLDLEAYQATRRIIVPASLDFYQLHHVLQKVFNWKNNHLYDFKIFAEQTPQLITRLVPYEQALEYDPNATLMGEHHLSDYFPKYKDMIYTYDLGDSWDHVIELVRMIDGHDQPSPYLLEASGQTPPEDVGGVGGFLHFREVLKDPKHPNHGEMKSWAGYWEPELSDWEKQPRIIKE